MDNTKQKLIIGTVLFTSVLSIRFSNQNFSVHGNTIKMDDRGIEPEAMD